MDYLFLVVVALLSVFGFVSLVRSAVFWLLRLPRGCMTLVTRLEDADSAENNIRSVVERIKWMDFPARLVFLYPAGDTETRVIAEKIISKYPEIGLLCETDLNYNEGKWQERST